MVIQQAKEVLRIESEGILNLIDRIGQEFADAVDLIYQAKGRVIVTGIGKSGIVGRKIVATFSSTGTPSLFLHPVEAMHGDLGMLVKDDIVLALSNSGETVELNALMPIIRGLGAKVVAMTGGLHSTLAGNADVVLDVGVAREACPLGLAPMASTTAALAMGDALAAALINRRHFNSFDFRRLHPGGNLGERLSLQVSEVMTTGRSVPEVAAGTPATEAIKIMDERNLGVLLVVGPDKKLEGLFTDGDLRRCLVKGVKMEGLKMADLMNRSPRTIGKSILAVEALEIMQAHEFTILPIVDRENRLEGVIHLHDLLGKGKIRFNPPIPVYE